MPETADLDVLRGLFTGRLLLPGDDPAAIAPFLVDWRGRWHGAALAVAQPDTVDGVCAVMRWCHQHRVPVVPQGGNTGLSGGSVPDDTGRALVLSLSRLNRVRQVDTVNNTLVVEAGVTLAAVQQAAAEAGRLFPLSLAAEGSCTIGGNLATNAGGVQVLRYGNARALCLGLEVVTPEGELWQGLHGLRKDNTGYDLRDLYIGAEGTLGIITAASLTMFPRPAGQAVALVAVDTPAAALQLLQHAQQQAADQLTAFELMSELCLKLVARHMPSCRMPLSTPAPWFVLLEVSHPQSAALASSALESLLEGAMEAGWVLDAAVSQSETQRQALWALRENISEAQGAEGKTIKHDISVPISRIAAFVEATSAAVAQAFPEVRLVVFGHLGDGNLHYNVSPAEGASGAAAAAGFLALEAPLNALVHDAVAAAGGSISAEHGLGVLRRDEALRYRDPVAHRLMLQVKQAFDPLGLMNPGKLLPR
ncbi:FAD-binding oxidoreductase [Ideonella margarita]|uniref:FAD-binding oxidoreductase n=1 Tax=Ideonella margarita TaxID=2984191 RepID=A0ABU9C454_9BURK